MEKYINPFKVYRAKKVPKPLRTKVGLENVLYTKKPTKLPKPANHELSERQRLYRALDKVAGNIVKLRDGKRCQRTGIEGAVDWAHIIGRGQKTTLRWHPWNALALKRSVHEAGHRYPVLFKTWFDLTYPKRADYINRVQEQPAKQIKMYDLEKLLELNLELFDIVRRAEPEDRIAVVDDFVNSEEYNRAGGDTNVQSVG